MRVVVLGAGVMGLASALDLIEDGHEVTVLEAAPFTGGLAGSFEFGDVRAERFYHFICGGDDVYRKWLRRLGLAERLRWRQTHMGSYHEGRLHAFGSPLSLLRFSPLSFTSRLRYGFHVWSAKRLEDWSTLENVTAKDWLIRGEGKEPYDVIWEPLLRDKFHDATESLSAAWIWSRIRRLASSRDSLFREFLGYLEGGTDVFIETLTQAVEAAGGIIHCDAPADEILLEPGEPVVASGVRTGGTEYPAQAVLSTIPLPILVAIGRNLPEDYRRAAMALDNYGVRCIIVKLSTRLTPYFWINVNDSTHAVCGLIELTNLHPPEAVGGYHLVYSPLYASSASLEYQKPSKEVFADTVKAMAAVSPRFDPSLVVDYRVFRAPYAQPVCPVGFTQKLAPLQTPVANLVAADTSHLLPHDRSISDSLALAERLTETLRRAMK